MLKTMRTDEEVEELFALASEHKGREEGGPDEYGSSVSEWSEMKMSGSENAGWF